MQSAYKAGLAQIANRPARFVKYRDGAIVGQQTTDDVGVALVENLQIPDWTAWAGGGAVGLIVGLIIAGRRGG